MLTGRDRGEAERFMMLRPHYRLDSFFCTPGPQVGHKKGDVEGEMGRFRHRHLVLGAVGGVTGCPQPADRGR